MDRQMDGWMEIQTYIKTDKHTERWMDGHTDIYKTHIQKNRQTDEQIGIQKWTYIDRQIDGHTDIEINTYIEVQTDRRMDGHTEMDTNQFTDKQTDIWIYKHKDKHIYR